MANLKQFNDAFGDVVGAAESIRPYFTSVGRYRYYAEHLEENVNYFPDSVPNGSDYFLQREPRLILTSAFYIPGAKVTQPVPADEMIVYMASLVRLLRRMSKLESVLEFVPHEERW